MIMRLFYETRGMTNTHGYLAICYTNGIPKSKNTISFEGHTLGTVPAQQSPYILCLVVHGRGHLRWLLFPQE
jgi:hypothetical protein